MLENSSNWDSVSWLVLHKKDVVYAKIKNLNIFSPTNELTTLGTARCFDIEELSDQPCLRTND